MKLMRKVATFQFTTTGIRVCGMIFLIAGAVGAMLQTQLLGAGNLTNSELFQLLEQDPNVMTNATLSMFFQAIGSCAVPIFCFLLVEGARNTSDYGKYCLRVLGLAVACQLPYNLLMTGSLIKMNGLNPVFAMTLCQIMLYFFRRFRDKGATGVLLKMTAIIGVFLWANILDIDHGSCCVVLTAVLWGLREKDNMRTIVGIMVMFSCSLFSMFYMAAPIGFLVLHFYEGKLGDENRIVNYLAYPVILLISGLMTVFM